MRPATSNLDKKGVWVYDPGMPAIAHKLVLDENGQTQEVILSIETFRHIQEVLGADLSEREEQELREALADSRDGKRSEFVSMEDI